MLLVLTLLIFGSDLLRWIVDHQNWLDYAVHSVTDSGFPRRELDERGCEGQSCSRISSKSFTDTLAGTHD